MRFLIALAALTACADVKIDGVRFACTADADCLPGFRCLGQTCGRPQPDAGAPITPEVRALATAGRFGCFARGDAVECWGEIQDGPCTDCQPYAGAPITVARGVTVERMWGGRSHVCWESGSAITCVDRDGRPRPVNISSGPIDLAIGDNGLCAVTAESAIICAGAGVRGPRAPERPPFAGEYSRVAVGVDHVCAVVAGSIACSGPVEARAGLESVVDVVDVAATDDGTCVRTRDQRIRCSNNLEALPDLRYTALFASTHVVCGTTDDRVVCRGVWTDFITPTPPSASVILPLPVGAQLHLGGSFACLLDRGNVDCFGTGGVGELGPSVPTVFAPFPLPSVPKARLLGGGEWRTCLITIDGRTGCFGSDMQDPTEDVLARPFTEVDVGGPPRALDSGFTESCAIRADGALACFFGRRTRVDPGPYQDVAIGNRLGCAITLDRRVECFSPESDAPAALIDTSAFGATKKIAVAGETACGLFDDGRIACWGANPEGFIRSGTTAPVDVPILVAERAGSSSIAIGLVHGCVLGDDGIAACWGHNGWGQVGRPTAPTLLPLAPITGGPYVDLDAGIFHTCAVRRDGRVDCWGQSFLARLGRIHAPSTDVPTEVPGVAGAIDVAVGRESACARGGDGTITCWGWSPTGSLTGAYPGSDVPLRVLP